MKLSRYLPEAAIKLEMETVIEPLPEGGSLKKWRDEAKRKIINELVDLLEDGARIGNRTKLLNDFVNREKKATTGIGHGVALPHIRSLQAKDLTLAFARSKHGYDFESLDNQPTHMFFVMAAIPSIIFLQPTGCHGISIIELKWYAQFLIRISSRIYGMSCRSRCVIISNRDTSDLTILISTALVMIPWSTGHSLRYTITIKRKRNFQNHE